VLAASSGDSCTDVVIKFQYFSLKKIKASFKFFLTLGISKRLAKCLSGVVLIRFVRQSDKLDSIKIIKRK
jgi:hypothetical protein